MSAIRIQCGFCLQTLQVVLGAEIPSPCPSCGANGRFRFIQPTGWSKETKPKCEHQAPGILKETERLLLTDAEFRAKAWTAADIAAEALRDRTGGGVLQRHERKVVEHAAAIALVLEIHNQSEISMSLPDTCSQCGSAYKVCAHCGEKIIFVPKAGFGNLGDWQHIEPYSANRGGHIPHPVLHVT